MAIRSAEVLVSSPGRNFAALRITTDEGGVGLGVDYDDEPAKSYEYTPAYLPANRLLDGTVHDW